MNGSLASATTLCDEPHLNVRDPVFDLETHSIVNSNEIFNDICTLKECSQPHLIAQVQLIKQLLEFLLKLDDLSQPIHENMQQLKLHIQALTYNSYFFQDYDLEQLDKEGFKMILNQLVMEQLKLLKSTQFQVNSLSEDNEASMNSFELFDISPFQV